MTIEDREMIDVVATLPGSAEVRLVISDHLDWRDPHDHCLRLRAKLSTYVEFIESGQMREFLGARMPTAPAVSIEVAAVHPLPSTGLECLMQTGEVLAPMGIRLLWEQRPSADGDAPDT